MKHPLHKLSKKNRNVISGVLVGLAAIFAVLNFFNLPREQIQGFVISTALFVLGIILLAIITIVIFKLLVKLKDILFGK